MKIGFIGVGNMGSAMVKGILKANIQEVDRIYLTDLYKDKLAGLVQETGAILLDSPVDVVRSADLIILAVKPGNVKEVLESCKDEFDASKILLSIAVGIPRDYYRKIIGNDKKIIRAMPNTPALVGEGMTLLSYDNQIHEDEAALVTKILSTTGKVEILSENLMNEVTALTGSSPAYVFMLIEAMGDGAVLSGIPRMMAYQLAAQAVLGSAKMVLETGKHPGELKDQVCSPAGTTIEAVAALERNGFRYGIMDAMKDCTIKARQIGKKYDEEG